MQVLLSHLIVQMPQNYQEHISRPLGKVRAIDIIERRCEIFDNQSQYSAGAGVFKTEHSADRVDHDGTVAISMALSAEEHSRA
jgi:hypothetical protein